MFKSIECLRYYAKIDSYIYKIIDTNFECEMAVPPSPLSESRSAVATILEYKKRNYSDKEIVKNLFRCNLYLCNKYKGSFEEILNRQNIYIDQDFKDINFSKLYYQELKGMWDKYKAFI